MRQWWRRVVRDYFTFSTSQRNGLTVLCILVLVAAFVPRLVLLFQKDEPADFTEFKKEIDSLKKYMRANVTADSSMEKPSLMELDETKRSGYVDGSSAQLFSFDPNTATANDFKDLGLRDKQIKIILNYRNKGGKFFAKEDFKKMYGLSEQDYNRLSPYIQIVPHQKNVNPQSSKSYSGTANTYAQPALLDLNGADSAQLVALPGIGPVLSSRIIKLRNKLGGFYSVDQLKEVYGMADTNFVLAKEKIYVNPIDVKKININNVSGDDLKKHPYFKSIVQPLINYREQHGDFKTLEELKNIDVITEELYQKIIPYLEI